MESTWLSDCYPSLQSRFPLRSSVTGDWQLFDLRDDPAELHDLSKKHPEKREAMLKLWDEYVTTNGIVLTEDGPFSKRKP